MKVSLLRVAKTAFSLVEVTLALGLITFALVAIMGLLPTGLASIKNANEQAGAASTLSMLAESLRGAEVAPDGRRVFRFGETNLAYSLGGSGWAQTWTNLNLDGNLAAPAESPRLSARLEILATPTTNNTPGRAVVSVAWSALSNPEWDAQANRWNKADGSLVSGVIFLPKP